MQSLYLKILRELARALKNLSPASGKPKAQAWLEAVEHRMQAVQARKTAQVNVAKLWANGPAEFAPPPRAVDILIPVYNGYDFLAPCLDSVIKNTDLPFHIYLGNDKSPDERVLPLLQSYAQRHPGLITVLNHEQNLGFVKNCNRLITASQNDFVLLNTDTEVPPGWASRLFYPIFSDPRVAVTGPWTNSGSHQAFFFGHEAHALDVDYKQMDNFVRRFSPDTPIYFPNMVGFAMAVSRAAQKEIGLLDEAYGRGYFEETDFCFRATGMGFLQRLSVNVFVYHKGGCSFKEEANELMHKNHKIFRERYPHSHAMIRSAEKEIHFQVLHFLTVLQYLFIKNPALFSGVAAEGAPSLSVTQQSPGVWDYEARYANYRQKVFLTVDPKKLAEWYGA